MGGGSERGDALCPLPLPPFPALTSPRPTHTGRRQPLAPRQAGAGQPSAPPLFPLPRVFGPGPLTCRAYPYA